MTETTPREGLDRAVSAPASGSMTELVSGILTDAQTLIKQQATMLRAEFKEDIRRTGDVAKYMSIGIVVAAVGVLFLVISLVFLIQHYAPSLPLWACWAIVGAVLVVTGLVALYAGKKILDSYNPLPDKTLHALEENLSWKTTTPQS